MLEIWQDCRPLASSTREVGSLSFPHLPLASIFARQSSSPLCATGSASTSTPARVTAPLVVSTVTRRGITHLLVCEAVTESPGMIYSEISSTRQLQVLLWPQ